MSKRITYSLLVSIGVLASASCSGGQDGAASDGGAPTTDAVPTAGDGGETGSIPDAASSADAAPSIDCENLTPLPVSANVLTGFSGSEDFAFDAAGFLVSNKDGNVTRQPKSGSGTLLTPNVDDTAGTRFLSNGDLMLAHVTNGELWRISPDGGARTVLASLEYPNGLEVDDNDFVYVAEHDAGRIRRVNPDTGDFTIVATGLSNPNGLSFSPDYKTLYVNSFGDGTVHKMSVNSQGTWSSPQLVGDIFDGGSGERGGLDGMAVDACGNVYVTEYTVGYIWRFSPDGVREKVATLPSFWIPNMHWGSGIGGWDKNILYVMDREEGRLFELDLGITEKPRIYP